MRPEKKPKIRDVNNFSTLDDGAVKLKFLVVNHSRRIFIDSIAHMRICNWRIVVPDDLRKGLLSSAFRVK